MKTAKIKSILVTGMATFIAIVGINGFAIGQTTANAKPINLKQEKTAINKDLNRINLQQAKIKSLKQQCKDEHKAGVKGSDTHSEVMKAKADLKRDRAYLKADKTNLLIQHQAHIAQHRYMLNEQRAQQRTERRKLDMDLAKGNSAAVERAEAFVNGKQQIKAGEAKLRQAKLDRNEDVLAINKEIRDTNGQSAVALSIENGTAKASNLALK